MEWITSIRKYWEDGAGGRVIQITLEQQGLELHGSTYMQVFFNKYTYFLLSKMLAVYIEQLIFLCFTCKYFVTEVF